MKKLYYACLLMLVGILVVATPVLAAVYYANLQVQESDGNSYTRLPIMVSLDNEYLADNNYILATGLDTRVITGSSVELPWLVVDDRLLFVSNINANNTYNFKYTTGNTPPVPADMPVIVGYDGYITIPSEIGDDMQLGDDFEIETSGYVDTSDDGEWNKLIYKKDAFVVYISAEGEITAGIIASTTTSDTHILPNASGSYTNIASVTGSATHWGAVDDPVATPDDATTIVYTTSSTQQKDAYNLASLSSYPCILDLSSVAVYFRVASTNVGKNDQTQPFLRLGTDETTGTAVKPQTVNNTYVTASEVLARPGGGSWSWDDFDDLQVAIGLKTQDATSTLSCTQTYVNLTYDSGNTFTKSVAVTGISSGGRKVIVSAGANTMTLSVYDSEENHLGNSPQSVDITGVSVPDNANDIIINQNNVMPYFDYMKWTVSDTLIAWYQPISMIVGTTLDDREGTDAGETGTAEEDGTITWGANPAGVDVDIGSLTAYSQPAPSGTITEPGQDIVDETGQPGWTDETGTLTDNPFYPAVLMASEQTGFDVTQIWLMIATFFVIGGMLAVFGFVPHQLITVCVGGGITGFFVSMGIYPFWVIFIFLVMGIAVVLWERAPTV